MPISNVTNRRFPDKLAESETGTPWAVSDQPKKTASKSGRSETADTDFLLFLAVEQSEHEPATHGKHSRRGRFRNNGNAVKSGSQLARSANVTDKIKPPGDQVHAVEPGLPINCSREKGIAVYRRDVKSDAVGEINSRRPNQARASRRRIHIIQVVCIGADAVKTAVGIIISHGINARPGIVGSAVAAPVIGLMVRFCPRSLDT